MKVYFLTLIRRIKIFWSSDFRHANWDFISFKTVLDEKNGYKLRMRMTLNWTENNQHVAWSPTIKTGLPTEPVLGLWDPGTAIFTSWSLSGITKSMLLIVILSTGTGWYWVNIFNFTWKRHVFHQSSNFLIFGRIIFMGVIVRTSEGSLNKKIKWWWTLHNPNKERDKNLKLNCHASISLLTQNGMKIIFEHRISLEQKTVFLDSHGVAGFVQKQLFYIPHQCHSNY